MDEVIDQVMNSVEIISILNNGNSEEIRVKTRNYIATLSSAGRKDVDQLTDCGLAYLHQLPEGPDPRYTGC
jgi:hypothetical protein